MRGIIAGFVSGSAVSALALAGISVLGTVPGQSFPTVTGSDAEVETVSADVETDAADAPPNAVTLDVPPGSAFDQVRDDEDAVLPRLEKTELDATVSQLHSPNSDIAQTDVEVDALAGRQPDVSFEEVALTTPEIPENDATLRRPLGDQSDTSASGDNLSVPSEAGAGISTPEVGQSGFLQTPQRDSDEDTDSQSATRAATGAGTIGDLAQGVTTKRLPSIGDEGESALGTALEDGEDKGSSDTLTPLERHAALFENVDGKPVMSIVLIDDGGDELGPDALVDFPYPVSFAIDVTRSDAADVAARYRKAGHEVLAMTNLPENANAQDAEVAMATYLQAIPQAVAFFEGDGGGLQTSREASQQLGQILHDSGHGLVLLPNGLNTAQKLIARQGVPSATVFRDIDGAGQDARAIRRFLDQAAFKASQSDQGVIMLGRMRAETISALVLWGLQDRASSVALAPVSFVLREGVPES